MSRATDVVADAAGDVGTQYHWAPTPGALYLWAVSDPNAPLAHVGQRVELSINCFAYPMLLAVRRGYLNQNAVRRILGALNSGGDERAKAFSSWSSALWQDWPAGICGLLGNSWRPRAGDLVFFKGVIGGILGHVALSTGVITATGSSEVITFGEGRTTMGQATVNRSTVEALKPGYQSVHFIAPNWT